MSLRPTVEGLIALRGVDVVTEMTVLAEIGDLTRFDSGRELMSFLRVSALTPTGAPSAST